MSYETGMTPADMQAVMGGGNGFGGNNGWWIILFILLCGIGGWGGYGNQGGGNSVKDAYVLSSDFSMISSQLSDGFNGVDRKLDAQNSGLCDLGYANAQLHNQGQMSMMQGFNATQAQLADCCCKTQSNIERAITQGVQNTAVITNAIRDCCCDTEKQFMQTRFDAERANYGTLQAIDKLGDRIIGYMANNEENKMRDYIRRLETKQDMDSLYGRLRPGPIPAFPVAPPWYMGNGNGNFERQFA